MKVVVAIDSFKGSLSTFEAGNAIKEGVLRVYPDAEVKVSPLADGGEGTVAALIGALGGRMQTVTVHDPLGRPIGSAYGIVDDRATAILEMSAAAGITLIDAKERNPLLTSTYGVGEMIADAIAHGCRKFIVGIGGSATNDGGVGMLSALGFDFLDADGNPIAHGAEGLSKLARIGVENVLPHLKDCEFSIACDVKNPLCGKDGCSAVYGPQKGATEETVALMDEWLGHYANLTRTVFPHADKDYPGAGAAGGMGFAFLSYLGGKLRSGIELVIETTELERLICDADVVVTGEGRLDAQSCMGKAPIGVATAAKRHGKPVIAFSGCVADGARACNDHGIDAYFPILQAPCTLESAMDFQNAAENLVKTAEQAFRLVKCFGGTDEK